MQSDATHLKIEPICVVQKCMHFSDGILLKVVQGFCLFLSMHLKKVNASNSLIGLLESTVAVYGNCLHTVTVRGHSVPKQRKLLFAHFHSHPIHHHKNHEYMLSPI